MKEAESSIYGTKQIFLPISQCVVFYNGEKEISEEQMLLLSDAFKNKNRSADLELKVRMLNINYGYNEELMKKCRILEEFDVKKYERTLREEGIEIGREERRIETSNEAV